MQGHNSSNTATAAATVAPAAPALLDWMLTSTAVAGQAVAGFAAAEFGTNLWRGTYQCIPRSRGGHALTAVFLSGAAACAAEQQVAMRSSSSCYWQAARGMLCCTGMGLAQK